MSLNLEKDKKKNNIDWNFITFCVVLGFVGIVALIVNFHEIDKPKENKLEKGSYLKLQECRRIEQNKWHCNVSIVTNME